MTDAIIQSTYIAARYYDENEINIQIKARIWS